MMHSTKLFNKFFYAVTIVAFIFQLIMPTTVYADGEDPTPEPAPTSIPVDEATPAPTEEVAPTSIPVDEATPAPTEEIAPLPTDLVIPEGTDLVVLDENGQPLPLATEAAADVAATGDPQWCPDNVTPGTAGAGNCIGIGSTSMAALLTAITTAGGLGVLGNGTIWIEKSYVSANDTSKITINSTNSNSLTLKGGWDGGTSTTTSGVSTFTVPIEIYWGGQLTINNLTINGSAYVPVDQMLYIISTAADPGGSASAVTLSNVTVTGSKGDIGEEYGYGANIEAEGSVTVSDSNFNNNYEYGLVAAVNKGDIVVDNVTADGAYLSTDKGGDITVALSSFNGDLYAGLLVAYAGYDSCNPDWTCNITLSDVEANNSTSNLGAYLWTDLGKISVKDSHFDGNKSSGLRVETNTGDIIVNNITADNNDGNGAELNIGAGGNVTVSNSFFNENGINGISLGGDWGYTADGKPLPTFKLTNVTADHNTRNGLRFIGPIDEAGYSRSTRNVKNAAANILICSGSYSYNGDFGVNINNFGGSTTFGSTAVGNGGETGQNWLNPESADCVEVDTPTPTSGRESTIKLMTYEGFSEAVNLQEKAFNCDSYLGLVIYTEELKDEDHVMIPCGSKGSGTHASAFKKMESDLPGKPTEGTFVSALKLAIEDNDNAPAIHTGQVMVSFKLPEDANPSDYSIMFWNGTAWELVSNIFSADGYFQSWVNMLGYYMLIKN